MNTSYQLPTNAVLLGTLVSLLTVATGCGSDRGGQDNTSLLAEQQKLQQEWQNERIADLKAESGWLAVVGLHWLDEGEQTVGWGEATGIRLSEPPEAAPEVLSRVRVTSLAPGSSDMEEDRWQVELLAMVDSARMSQDLVQQSEADAVRREVTSSGELSAEWSPFLAPDGESPYILEFGSFELFVIERGGELALRVRNRSSKERERLVGIPLYDYDPSWVIDGQFEPAEGVRELAIDNSTDHDYPQRSVGRLVFEREGESFAMELIGTDLERPQLLMVGDLTNGESTYGGGRYLYVDVSEHGRITADLNRLYNPPCVFTAYATCPLPPSTNQLPFAVEVGEKYPEFAAP